MKNILIIIFLLELIKLSLSLVPVWDIEKTSLNLLSDENEKQYEIWKRWMYELNIIFKKIFIREESSIRVQNYITIKSKDEKNIYYDDNIEWDDLESFYKIGDLIYICPKGKYFMYYMNINDNSKEFKEIIPEDFSGDEKDWDLQCYYQEKENYMFIAFLNTNQNIFVLKTDGNNNNWKKLTYFEDGLYDFKWVTEPIDGAYPMKSLVLKDYFITLKGLKFSFYKTDSDNKITVNEKEEVSQFTKILSYSKANFNYRNEKDIFHFITYNNIYELISGYFNNGNVINYDDIGNIQAIINSTSPLEFIDEVEIPYMNFIKNQKYLYYEIKSKENSIIFHGIIDVEQNKVIFNSDENIIEFKPFGDNAMYAITEKSAYKVCTIKGDDDCISECSDNKPIVIYDISKPNMCGNEISCENFILKPNDICIDSCDETIFTIQNNKECGLCRDLDTEHPYKLLNTSKCLSEEEIPEGALISNERLKFVKCEKGINITDETCIVCYEKCETCSLKSNDENNQFCTSCKEDYILQEGNCIEECSNGYYQVEKECKQCSKSCKTCVDETDKCTNCFDNYYLDGSNNCQQCSESCKTCIDNKDKCTSCYEGYNLDENKNECNLICSELCKTCIDNKDKCTSCYEGYNLDENKNECNLICSELCKTCIDNKDKCTSCHEGYNLNNNINQCVKICSDNCLTCSKDPDENGNQNCLTCNQSSIYKYLIDDEKNHTCVEQCPKGRTLDKNKEKCIKKYCIIFWLCLLLLLILLLVIIYCIYRKCRKRQTTNKEIEDINKIEEKEMIN